MPFLRLAARVKHALPFLGALVGISVRGDTAAQNQSLVEPAIPRRENLRQYFERIRVAMLKRHGMPEDIHLRICFRLRIHALLGKLLHLERRDIWRSFRAARDALEILPGLRLGFGRVKVADENERDVLRRVIDRSEEHTSE